MSETKHYSFIINYFSRKMKSVRAQYVLSLTNWEGVFGHFAISIIPLL